MCEHRKLLLMRRPAEQPARRRIDFESHALWRIVWTGPTAFGDPLSQDRISRVALRELEPAAMRQTHHRLIQQQAALRIERIGTAAQILANERELIECRIERPQRQPKATF